MRFDRLSAIVQEQRGEFFGRSGKVTVARAPARMDVMGGIADYSGSLVLEGTLSEAAYAAVQPRSDRKLRAMTVNVKDVQQVVEFSLDDLASGGRLKSYAQVGKLFAGEAKWAGYVLGGLLHEPLRIFRTDRGAVVIGAHQLGDLLLNRLDLLGMPASASASSSPERIKHHMWVACGCCHMCAWA